jgi:hypothetical protein
MPRCDSEAMGIHLEEIAFHVAPGAHAVLILDQAAWHAFAALVVPANITLLPLPPKSPNSTRSERLAVHARQLALEPHLHIIRRYRRSLLLRMEHTRRSAVAHHVHRSSPDAYVENTAYQLLNPLIGF